MKSNKMNKRFKQFNIWIPHLNSKSGSIYTIYSNLYTVFLWMVDEQILFSNSFCEAQYRDVYPHSTILHRSDWMNECMMEQMNK